jgi:Spy/CpxP family protein refolding chaperone
MNAFNLSARRAIAGAIVSLAATLGVTPFAAATLAAQGAQPGQPPAAMSGHGHAMAGMKGGASSDPMMAIMAASPHSILSHRTALALSPAQVASLESLEKVATPAHDSVMQAMAPLHEQMGRAMAAPNYDEGSVKDALDKMGQLHARMMGDMLRTAHAARQILTDEQRQHLAALPMDMKGNQGMSCGAM